VTTIRHAEPADLARIVEMGETFVASSHFKDLGPADPHRIAALTRTLAQHPDGCVFVAEVEGRVVGMLAGHIPVHPMLDVVMASELVWWVDVAHRTGRVGLRLLTAFEGWARDHGASHVQMIAPNEKVAAFYDRLKFERVEIAYARRV